jgi:G8 domain/Right handed beta helix region
MKKALSYGLWSVIATLAACGGGSKSSIDPSITANSNSNSQSIIALTTDASGAVVTVNGEKVNADAWSNPALWGGTVPGTGAAVVIPAGKVVVLDVDSAKLSSLVVNGKLIAASGKSVTLTADSIMVQGSNSELRAGSANEPFDGQFQIKLSGTNPAKTVMDHGAKVLSTMAGGTLALYGSKKQNYTRLAATAQAGEQVISLAEDLTGWKIGDAISIAPTDFQPLEAEKRIIKAINGRSVTLDSPLSFTHWGEAPEQHGTHTLDMRAHVGNLTRNIKISSIENEEIVLPGFDPDSYDATGKQNGAGKRSGPGRFGGHMMFMAGSSAQLDHVEVTALGQQGMLGRYPVHWHLSRDASKEGNFIRNSSIHSTFQRGIVLHQANGIEVEDNVLFDIPGHGVYMEDGIEHDNTIARNLVTLVRYVPRKHRLSVKDTEKPRAEKLSGFWITNPANWVRDNVVAGVQNGWGFIFANVLEDKVPVINPSDKDWADNRSYIGFTGNTAYAISFMPSVPDGGDSVFNLGYGPEEAGSCFRFNFAGDYRNSTQLKGLTAFKCANAATWSTNFLPVKNAVFADSRTAIVNNQGEAGVSALHDSAVIGMTRNNPVSRKDFTFGPFDGPGLKESLEAGPVTFDNVVTSYKFLEQFAGFAPAMNNDRSSSAGFRLNLPSYVAVKANSTKTINIQLDRSGGYQGNVDITLDIPKPANLAVENPYFYLSAMPLQVQGSVGTLTLNNSGAAERSGNGVAIIRAKGDSTILSTLRILTATQPTNYVNAAHGNNLSRLIAGDSPRNPAMSSTLQNAGGQYAIDGSVSSHARFDASSIAPWIRLDFERSYYVNKVVIEWDPAFMPTGDLLLSLSEFDVFDSEQTMVQAKALAADIAQHRVIAAPFGSLIEIDLPPGTAARQVKLWSTHTGGEVRLREISFISQ